MTIIEKRVMKIYSDETLKHLRNVQLMILKDFINFCDKHNIIYFMDGGSVLGCIRHGGFIPWDDDIDVLLMRDQYEKFLKYSYELNDKYDILNSDNYEYYCRLYSKISLKGTKVDEIFDRNTDFNFGINIDIFVYDKLPKPKFKINFFKLERDLFSKLLWLYELTISDVYVSKNKEKMGHIIRIIFKLLHFNNIFFKKWGNRLINKSKKSDSKYLCNLSTTYSLFKFNKSIFGGTKKVKFENLDVNIPVGFDEYLSILYGNYMVLPPKEEQVNHGYNYIYFGEY